VKPQKGVSREHIRELSARRKEAGIPVMAMKIRLKLYGVFRATAGRSELVIEITDGTPTVRSVISQFVSGKEYESLRQLLFEKGSSDPRPNALIMVSGREINTLSGLETSLTENDELALLPVAHGG